MNEGVSSELTNGVTVNVNAKKTYLLVCRSTLAAHTPAPDPRLPPVDPPPAGPSPVVPSPAGPPPAGSGDGRVFVSLVSSFVGQSRRDKFASRSTETELARPFKQRRLNICPVLLIAKKRKVSCHMLPKKRQGSGLTPTYSTEVRFF